MQELIDRLSAVAQGGAANIPGNAKGVADYNREIKQLKAKFKQLTTSPDL